MKFDLCSALMINHSNHVLIVFIYYISSKHKLTTILMANVANLARFVKIQNIQVFFV